MKTHTKIQNALGIAGATLLVLPLTAFGAGVTAQTSIGVGVSGSSSSSATNIQSSSTLMTGTGQAATNGNSSSSASITSNNANNNSGNQLGLSGNSVINLSQTDATAYQGASVTSPDQVSDNASLTAYADSQIKNNTSVSSVSISSNNIQVSYKDSGKLFGFIPVSEKTSVSANNDGSVTVSHPWYDFLIAGNNDDAIKTSVASKVNASIDASANASSSLQAKARILDAIISALHSSSSANASASANTNATASY